MRSPLLVVLCGLPGVGKSTVSEYTADELGAARHRSDEVRYDLFDDPEYTPEEMRRTYDELLDRTRSDLEAGRDVVVDATFKKSRERDRVARLAEETGVTLTFVRVTCPPEVVRERITARTDDPSDADLSVYYEHREEFEPLARDHVTIDNSETPAETRRQIDEHILDGYL